MEQPVLQDVTVTKSRILEAAKVSEHAKQTLKTLFPEVFTEEKYFNLDALGFRYDTIFTTKQAMAAGFRNNHFLQVRSVYEYSGKGFYLQTSGNIIWELVKDRAGETILLPTRKS